MIVAHVNALAALLTAQGLAVSKGYPTDAAGVPIVLPDRPYVVLTHDSGKSSRDFEARSESRYFRFRTVVVGDSDDAVSIAAAKVFAGLLDVRPAVSGRVCGPIDHVDTDETRPDTDSNPPVFVGVDEWALLTAPA